MLRACLLLWLAGCDLVWSLDRAGHDEDGDGIPDDSDLCPHLPTVQTDSDDDGLGNDCDPGPGAHVGHFFTFLDGTDGLAVSGTTVFDGDDLVFGAPTEQPSTMFLLGTDGRPADVGDGLIDLGFTILDPAPDGSYHETGVVFENTDTSDLGRGQLCFAGYDEGTTDPVETYLEMTENITRHTFDSASTTLQGSRGRLVAKRDAGRIDCTLSATGVALTNSYMPAISGTGRLGVYQQHARARLHYLWIATRPSPASP